MPWNVLSFQCKACSLVFDIEADLLANVGESSEDDFCCPLCRSNTLMLFVEEREA